MEDEGRELQDEEGAAFLAVNLDPASGPTVGDGPELVFGVARSMPEVVADDVAEEE